MCHAVVSVLRADQEISVFEISEAQVFTCRSGGRGYIDIPGFHRLLDRLRHTFATSPTLDRTKS